MKRVEMQQALGLRHEGHFRNVYLTPAIAAGEDGGGKRNNRQDAKWKLTARNAKIAKKEDV